MDIAARTRSTGIYAVVTRADGTVEDFGLISYRHRNPLITWAVTFYIYLKRKLYG